MSAPLLDIENLTIQYGTSDGNLTAVSDANITVEAGEYYGLAGESGCGKSTIAKGIVGGLPSNGRITSGTIRYRGREIQNMTESELNEEIRWKEISYIPQNAMTALNPLQSISDKAVEIGRTHTDYSKEEILERLRDAFDIVGISHDRIGDYPHQFSGGMLQRSVIALALFLNPSFVIADEPTTALDVIMQDQVFRYLNQIRDTTDISMLLITHNVSVIVESCEKMAVMHSGQIAESGSMREVYNNPAHPYTIFLKAAFPDIRYPDRELHVTEGHPPQNVGDVDYCTFVDRCPLATDVCGQRAPELESMTDDPGSAIDHKAACFHTDETDSLDEMMNQATQPTERQ